MEERKQISLGEAKKMQFEMLKSFNDFCTKNGITYFLAYGTLLGAIRHKGYIPWDDDIDVMIPQHEFERLINIYHSERYPIFTCFNNKEHPYPFARVYDNSTYKLMGNYQTLGLFVDMYIIYGAPDSEIELEQYLKMMERTRYWNERLVGIRSRLSRYGLWPKKNQNFELLNLFCKYVVRKNRQYDYDSHSCSYIHCGAYLKTYPRSIFEKTSNVSFDGELFPAPVGYDEFLRITYGDYMRLPPEDKRVPYHGNAGCFLK